jgi:predicted nucleic acid-binding protein
MAKKFIVFDAGPLISMAMSGTLEVLEKLKEKFDGEFVLTPQVKEEVIDKPSIVKKYELEAVKIRNLLEKKVLKPSSDFVSTQKLEQETKKMLKNANTSLYAAEQPITIIQEGEASCLAFASLCDCEPVLVVDERTTRMLVESPDNLRQVMERKFHSKINADDNKIKLFRNFKIVRSAELLFIAYKKGLFEYKKDKQLLDALLYAVKYSGTAISSREIEEMKAMAK